MKVILISLIAMIASTALHASLRDLDYDGVRKEGGFGSETMVNVCRIEASNVKLTADEKTALLISPYFHHVHTLDLSGQEIDDSFIEKLACNTSLGRLMNLDLSNNPDVTDKALEYIRSSTVFGSVRDLPQVSARYGGPSTTVCVKRKNTAASKTAINPVFYFGIDYVDPITGRITFEHADQGIKLISVE